MASTLTLPAVIRSSMKHAGSKQPRVPLREVASDWREQSRREAKENERERGRAGRPKEEG